jgi:hypothetical protein
MKTIIAGMRDFHDYKHVMRAIKKAALLGITIDELVCGMAPGVDMTGYYFAKMARIPIKEMPADWDNITVPGALVRTRKDGTQYNALAGPMRNEKMAQYADSLIAIWNGVSTGTGDMIDRMRHHNKRLLVWDVTKELDLI